MQVARCIPFLMQQFECEELTTKHKLRRTLAERFQQHKGVKNPDVRRPALALPPTLRRAHSLAAQTVNILIYKGRQELEVCV